MRDQLQRFAEQCVAVNVREFPASSLPLFFFDVIEIVILIPQSSFLEVVVGQQRLRVVLDADRQKEVVEAFLQADVESVLLHDAVEDRIHHGIGSSDVTRRVSEGGRIGSL